MGELKYNYIFVKKELINILNELGYVHFVTNDKVSDFKEGRAFYYCNENKKYGYVDVVPNSEIHNIEKNEEYLRQELTKDNVTSS